MMTPYEIEYLICLVTKGGEDRFDKFPSSSVKNETMLHFQRMGFASSSDEPTDKARFYLDYLCSVPTPVGSWRIDWKTDGSHEKPIPRQEFSIPDEY
jgi:hypothetical protein